MIILSITLSTLWATSINMSTQKNRIKNVDNILMDFPFREISKILQITFVYVGVFYEYTKPQINIARVHS